MDQQEKFYCPTCGKAIKVGLNFCTNCGVKLSELDVNVTISEAPPQSQTTNVLEGNLLMKGWEVSPDRIDKFNLIIAENPLGSPIITSKCKLDNQNGLLVVSDSGFAWRIQVGFKTSAWNTGKDKWIRWYDIANIIPKKHGQVLVELKIRKYGSLLLDASGNPKIKKWKLTIKPNKGEPKDQWMQRLETFNDIMLEIYNRNKVDTDPTMSDSRM
ncbi:MAG: zinc ribbon domain-containing protein [Promethearchaeota archaeon]